MVVEMERQEIVDASFSKDIREVANVSHIFIIADMSRNMSLFTYTMMYAPGN